MTGDPKQEAEPTRRGAWWRAGLFASIIVSTGLCLAFAFWPEKQTRAEIVWEPRTVKDSGALVLSRGWPSTFTFSASCSNLRSVQPVEFLNAGGLVLKGNGNGRLALTTATPRGFWISQFPPERHTRVSTTLPEGRCELRGGFRAQEQRIWLRVRGSYVEKSLPRAAFPPVTQLRLGRAGKPVVERVEIVTRPTGIESSPERLILGALAFLALGLAVSLSVLKDGGSSIQLRRRLALRRNPFRLPDLGVALLLVCAAFLIPSFPDDGWVWARVEASGQTGVFSNLFTSEDAWFFQGFLNEVILSALVDIGASFLDLRLIVVLVLIAAWVALRIWVLEPLVGKSSTIVWPGAMGFTAFASVYLVTLRAEPWVVLCVCACWIALAAFIRRPSQAALFFGLAFGAFALSIHQSGWVVIGPLMVLAWLAFEGVRGDQISVFGTLRTAFLAGLIGVTVVALPFSVPTVLGAISDFSSAPDSYHNTTLSELPRYVQLFTLTSFPRLFIVIGFVVVLLFFFLFVLTTTKRQTNRLLLVAIAVSFAALLFTSSKWAWHFGVLAPSFGLLLPIILGMLLSVRSKISDRSGPAILLTILVICVMFAASTEVGFGSHDFAERSWERLALKIGPGEQTVLWAFLLMLTSVGLVIGSRLNDQRWQVFIAGGVSLVLISPALISFAWIGLDSLKSEQWTLAKQNLSEGTNGMKCGTLSNTHLISGSPKPLEQVEEVERELVGYKSLMKRGSRPLEQVRGPFPTVAAWGASQTVSDVRHEEGSGSPPEHPISPLYHLGGVDSVTLWTWSRNPFVSPGIEIIFLSSDGSSLARRPLRVPDAVAWKGFNPQAWFVHRAEPVPDARFIYLARTQRKAPEDSRSKVSTPTVASLQEPKKVLESGNTFVGPFERLHVPCVRGVVPQYGYWPKIQFLIRDEESEELVPVNQDTVTRTSIGCSRFGRTCVERLSYRQAVVKRTEVVSLPQGG